MTFNTSATFTSVSAWPHAGSPRIVASAVAATKSGFTFEIPICTHHAQKLCLHNTTRDDFVLVMARCRLYSEQIVLDLLFLFYLSPTNSAASGRHKPTIPMSCRRSQHEW